jgi:hypothetical protein
MENLNNQFSSDNLSQDNLPPSSPLPPKQPKPSDISEVSLPEIPMPKMPDSSSIPQSTQIPQNTILPQASNKPPMPDVSAYNFEPEKRKSSSVLMLLIVIIILLLVSTVALGAILYTKVWDPVWSPFRSNPDEVLGQMMLNMQNVKTVSSQTKVNLSTDDGKKINIDFSGVSDVTDKLNPKSSMKAGIVFSNTAINSSDSLRAEVIVLDKNLYFKISEMNVPSFDVMFLMFGIDPSKVIGTWVKVPQDMQNKIASKDSSAMRDLTQEEMAEFTDKMQKIIIKTKIFFVTEQLSDKMIDGEKMYNYVVTINNDNLLKVFGEIMQESINMQNNLIENKDENRGVNTVTPYMIGAMKGVIKEALDKIGEIKINVLIGKKDNLLYGFDVSKTINIADLTQGEMAGKINISLQGAESNFNEPVSIIAPSNFKTIDEIFPIEEFLDSQSKITPMPKLQYPKY